MSDSMTDSRSAHAPRREAADARAKAEPIPYLGAAVPVGLAGAGAVAVFVLILDALAGHPLGTPNALGAALLRGETFSLSAPLRPGLVFGYTLLHLAAFVSIACAAVTAEHAMARAGVAASLQFVVNVVGTLIGLQLVFGSLMMLLDMPFDGDLGFAKVLTTNLVAAFTMAIAAHIQGESRRNAR